MNSIREVTQQSFEQEVTRASVPVLVDFTAGWCAPCRALLPVVHAFAAENAGKVEVRSVDADAETELAARFGVRALPTLIVLEGGREVARHVGLTTKDRLARLVASARSAPSAQSESAR